MERAIIPAQMYSSKRSYQYTFSRQIKHINTRNAVSYVIICLSTVAVTMFPSVLVLVRASDFPTLEQFVHEWEMDVADVDVYGRPGFAFFNSVQADLAMDVLFKARIGFTVFKETQFDGGPPPVPHSTPEKDVSEGEQQPVGETVAP